MSFASGDKNVVKLKFQVQKKVPFGKQVSIVGSNEVIGAWNPKNALPLCWTDDDVWQGEAELSSGPLEFKLIVKDDNDIEWQEGDNLVLDIPEMSSIIEVEADWESPSVLKIVEQNLSLRQSSNGSAVAASAMESILDQANDNGNADTLDKSMLNGLKVVELRKLAKERGVPTSGKKAELIERLLNNA